MVSVCKHLFKSTAEGVTYIHGTAFYKYECSLCGLLHFYPVETAVWMDYANREIDRLKKNLGT